MASQPPSARGMRLIPRRRPHAHATSRLTHKPRLVHSLSLRVRLRDPPWTQAPNHPRTRCTVSDVFGVDNPPGSRSAFPESEAAVRGLRLGWWTSRGLEASFEWECIKIKVRLRAYSIDGSGEQGRVGVLLYVYYCSLVILSVFVCHWVVMGENYFYYSKGLWCMLYNLFGC